MAPPRAENRPSGGRSWLRMACCELLGVVFRQLFTRNLTTHRVVPRRGPSAGPFFGPPARRRPPAALGEDLGILAAAGGKRFSNL